MKTTLGGDRLGSGNKQEIAMKNYERSSHDLSYIWRSSMASGTLVPFMSELALPGDSFDIDLMADVKTLPTVGPLYGTYKVQMDVFSCPVRLYQGKLHMNLLNIGMDMSEVKLPQINMEAFYDIDNKDDNSQINSSSIYSYLNMRGLGAHVINGENASGIVDRSFNGLPYLGYWDIYKNYYANKQEERGFVIHNDGDTNEFDVEGSSVTDGSAYDLSSGTAVAVATTSSANLEITLDWAGTGTPYGAPDWSGYTIRLNGTNTLVTSVFTSVVPGTVTNAQGVVTGWTLTCNGYTGVTGEVMWQDLTTVVGNTTVIGGGDLQLVEFPLDNIDDMRKNILKYVDNTNAYQISKSTPAPYGLGLGSTGDEENPYYYKLSSQEGLGIKTYQSDLFNNWISTEWIDGDDGINSITAVSTQSGEFTIDSLNLANKVYNMLNRIAISGGDYDSWLDAVYTHERARGHENPIYHGSLIKELGFEEVISQADTEVGGNTQPLGTLAGRGRMTGKNKGGKIKIKVDEPSYIIGIVSLTPRVDYSQGNKWDTNLKTMNDFHKPALDEIGFQDLVTDQMAWFDTRIDDSITPVQFRSAGKQPAWINYMTNVNQTRGSFAEENNSMFMTLNRRYDHGANGIGDLTTYVDPSKFNQIFAQTELDAQNFWVQINSKIFARRKMSAKVIPNL